MCEFAHCGQTVQGPEWRKKGFYFLVRHRDKPCFHNPSLLLLCEVVKYGVWTSVCGPSNPKVAMGCV